MAMPSGSAQHPNDLGLQLPQENSDRFIDNQPDPVQMLAPSPLPPLRERIMVGSLFICMDVAAIVPLTAVIAVIARDKKLRNMQAYRLMLYIGVLDFIHLCCDCVAGVFTIWPPKQDLSTKYVGGLMETSWIFMMFLTFVLSVNRLLVIVGKAATEKCIVLICKALTTTSCLVSLFILTAFSSSFVVMRYEVSRYVWLYVRSMRAYYFSIAISSILTPLSLISLANYLLILTVIVWRKKCSISSTPVSANEMRILFQSLAMFSFTTTGVFFDFFNFYLLPPTKWMYFGLTMMRQICIFMIPYLNIICNKTIRTKTVELLWSSSIIIPTVASRVAPQHARLFKKYQPNQLTSGQQRLFMKSRGA